jgi:hypothetical protein
LMIAMMSPGGEGLNRCELPAESHRATE